MTSRTPEEEEIRAAYRQGEEAVVGLFMQTVSIIDELAARVKQLEDRLAKNSGNSNKSPSSNGYKK
jgi:BMFP domain-containing protein YqiC